MLPCKLPIEKECNRPECSDGAIPNGINTIKDARMHVLGGTNLILPIEPLPPESYVDEHVVLKAVVLS